MDLTQFLKTGFDLTSGPADAFAERDPLPPVVIPYISSPEAWENFNNEVLYEADKMIREWVKEMRKSHPWRTKYCNRKYTFSMLFKILFGRDYTPQDQKLTRPLAKLFRYYSSKVMPHGYINGKQYQKTTYTISPTRGIKVPPYSLKLRLEWLEERGETPNGFNMRMAKDIEVGSARNPQTQANIERRRKAARERYYERKRAKDSGSGNSSGS